MAEQEMVARILMSTDEFVVDGAHDLWRQGMNDWWSSEFDETQQQVFLDNLPEDMAQRPQTTREYVTERLAADIESPHEDIIIAHRGRLAVVGIARMRYLLPDQRKGKVADSRYIASNDEEKPQVAAHLKHIAERIALSAGAWLHFREAQGNLFGSPGNLGLNRR